jgi:uncharacterized membrane protein
MRRVADRAAFDLHRFVFIDEGSGFIGMTLEANQIFGRRGSQLPGQESAMRVVAVGAIQEAFIDAVMEGPRKLLLVVEMAAVAKRRLACL